MSEMRQAAAGAAVVALVAKALNTTAATEVMAIFCSV